MMEMISGQFGDSYEPVMDGVANVIKNYAYWLNKKYGKCYVITPAYPRHTDIDDFEVLRYLSIAFPIRPPYRLGIPQLDIKLYKKLGKTPFNIVHAHSPFGAGLMALQIAKKRGIPIIATFHSKYYDDFKQVIKMENLTQYCIRKIVSFYNSVDFVWTVNKSTEETLRSYGFKGNVDIIRNGTDFDIYGVLKIKREDIEKRLNITPDEQVFLFVGQHVWQKNLRMLIQALHSLKGMGIKFKMIFAGRGYAEEDMKNLACEFEMQDSIKFIGIIVDRDFLKALYTRADLFLFPSVYDNAPIVVREAAAMKCPSLLIKDSNAAEGIIDNYNGFLAKNDPLAFAARIMEIISDREKLYMIGENAQKTLFLDWEQIVDEVNGRYLDIINTSNKINVGCS